MRSTSPTSRVRRVPLGRTSQRLSFERRLWVWMGALACPFLLTLFLAVHKSGYGVTLMALATATLAWAIAALFFFDTVIRPLQTLSNIVAALREDDYSFRARGARRNDALGDLALEINALAATLQQQRNSARDALSLADRVISTMQSPVLALDEDNRLRLLNAAAESTFQLSRSESLFRRADVLGLEELANLRDQSVYTSIDEQNATQRWSVRRSAFRLNGLPHTLYVLSDVSAALQREEREAWRRLIRVLGHEINNSLTPIKSIAASLRSRPLYVRDSTPTSQDLHDLRRGLSIIEDRAESLNRFLQAYQQLSRLPEPRMRIVSLQELVGRTLPLESRLRIRVVPAKDESLRADPDQMQQMLINLVKNATEAALDPELRNSSPSVELAWTVNDGKVTIQITDNGPGLANAANLFVPFYTTKPEGTGIGLTLSREIVTAHGGTVMLRNRDDARGCVAEVTLPRLEVAG